MRNYKENAETKEWFSADGGAEWGFNANTDWNSADAERMGEGVPQVQNPAPYILQIVNACTSAISNVDIGDSYANREASNFGQNSNITITSTVSGGTYKEFLAQSETQPFKVGSTMLICTTAGQLDQTIAITHRNAGGKRQDDIMSPTLTLDQKQTDRVIDYTEFVFDGMTRLRINQINGSATLTIRLYLISKFASIQIVQGRPGEVVYGKPRIIASEQLKLDRGF